MKCPVCDRENPNPLCAGCGYDSSQNREAYPTTAPLGYKGAAISQLRKAYLERIAPKPEPAPPPPDDAWLHEILEQPEPAPTPQPEPDPPDDDAYLHSIPEDVLEEYEQEHAASDPEASEEEPDTKPSWTFAWIVLAVLALLFLLPLLVQSCADKKPVSLQVYEMPRQTDYFVGDALDTAGLTLLVTYGDGSMEILDDGYSCTPSTLNQPGQQTVSVTCQGLTTAFTVQAEALTVKDISVLTLPHKQTYYTGDTLDTTGLTLRVTYSNGTTQEIDSGFRCSPSTLYSAGSGIVLVEYSSKTTSFPVTVKENSVQSMEILSYPNKLTYFVGEQLDTTGLTLRVTYSDGTTREVDSGFRCSPSTLNSAGPGIVLVEYSSKTTSFPVTVKPREVAPSYTPPFALSFNDVTVPLHSTFTLPLKDANGWTVDATWTVEDPSICTVDGNEVTACKVGKTKVFTTIGGTTYTCTVRVTS